MAKAGWYVIQVQTGREQITCAAIEDACEGIWLDDDRPLLEECFSPSCMHRLKYGGEWCDVEKPLLPGYLIAVTSDPAGLLLRLRRVPAFTKILLQTAEFIPLRDEERAWMEENTKAGERVIPLSVGYRKDGALVVTEGPLVGREAMVRRVIRKKCLAIVEIHANNKTITTEVGLALLPRE